MMVGNRPPQRCLLCGIGIVVLSQLQCGVMESLFCQTYSLYPGYAVCGQLSIVGEESGNISMSDVRLVFRDDTLAQTYARPGNEESESCYEWADSHVRTGYICDSASIEDLYPVPDLASIEVDVNTLSGIRTLVFDPLDYSVRVDEFALRWIDLGLIEFSE